MPSTPAGPPTKILQTYGEKVVASYDPHSNPE